MDTIATIVVTAFINIIITGIVSNLIFLRYQKKIENTFAKSMLEYQTKFVRNHEKMVETLETIYQEYSEFRLETTNFLYDMVAPIKSGKKVNLSDIDNATRRSDEIFGYFEKNSIYLPPSTSEEIRDVLSKTKLINSMITSGLISLESCNTSAPLYISPSMFFMMLGLWNMKLDDINEDSFDAERFFDAVIKLMKDYLKVVEAHYRSVAKPS